LPIQNSCGKGLQSYRLANFNGGEEIAAVAAERHDGLRQSADLSAKFDVIAPHQDAFYSDDGVSRVIIQWGERNVRGEAGRAAKAQHSSQIQNSFEQN
jgi:hypothetical protein